MTPAFAAPARAGKAAPLRLAFVYVPNGVTMADWTPKAAGADFEYSRILKPLEAFRKDTVVLSGLAHKNGNALGDGPGDHARAGASYLTGVHPKKTAGADILNGISVDQIAAQHLAGTDALFLARARLRRLAHRRQLRLRLLVRLHQQPRVARSDDPDAARDQSAPRLRAAVRRHRHERLAGDARPPACCTAAASSTWSASARRALIGRSGSVGSPQDRRIPVVDSRDRAAHREGREGHDRPHAGHRQADRHSRRVRRLRQPDVRPAARRVPDRLDARRHDDDGPRRQHAHLSGDRRARSASPADPSPQQPGMDREGHQGQRDAHGAVRRLHREDEGHAGRRRHARSITR